MKFLKVLAVTALALLGAAAPAWGAVWWIAPAQKGTGSGADSSNAGTLESPNYLRYSVGDNDTAIFLGGNYGTGDNGKVRIDLGKDNATYRSVRNNPADITVGRIEVAFGTGTVPADSVKNCRVYGFTVTDGSSSFGSYATGCLMDNITVSPGGASCNIGIGGTWNTLRNSRVYTNGQTYPGINMSGSNTSSTTVPLYNRVTGVTVSGTLGQGVLLDMSACAYNTVDSSRFSLSTTGTDGALMKMRGARFNTIKDCSFYMRDSTSGLFAQWVLRNPVSTPDYGSADNFFLRDTVELKQTHQGTNHLGAFVMSENYASIRNTYSWCIFKTDIDSASATMIDGMTWQRGSRGDSLDHCLLVTNFSGGSTPITFTSMYGDSGYIKMNHCVIANVTAAGAQNSTVAISVSSNDGVTGSDSTDTANMQFTNCIFYTQGGISWGPIGSSPQMGAKSDYNLYYDVDGSTTNWWSWQSGTFTSPGGTTSSGVGSGSTLCTNYGSECNSRVASPRFADSTYATFDAHPEWDHVNFGPDGYVGLYEAEGTDASAPTISLTRPDGGETWNETNGQTITWTASDDVGVTAIGLWYSTNNGTSWTSIAQGETNDGVYLWTVPSVASTNTTFKVKVWATDAANNQAGDSSAAFTVRDSLPVLQDPTGGETWEAGSTQNIDFDMANALCGAGDYEIAYSLNGGSSWTVLINSKVYESPPDPPYVWTLPGATTTTAQVRLRVLNASVGYCAEEISDAFNIVDTTPPSSVTISLPASIKLCETNIITIGGSDNVAPTRALLEYQAFGGSWTAIADTLEYYPTAFEWVPGAEVAAPGTAVRVRITAFDAQMNDTTITSSYSTAVDARGADVTVTYPNGSEIFYTGEPYEITWYASDCIDGSSLDILISYQDAYSSSWVPIINTTNTGNYEWIVPSWLADLSVKIKVVATDSYGNQGEDQSDAYFEVRTAGVLPPVRVRDMHPLGEGVDANGPWFQFGWSVPLKPEGGPNEVPSVFEVRRFEEQPTVENLTTAGVVIVTNTQASKSVGDSVIVRATGLDYDTKYWFVVRYQSASSGWSEMSIPLVTWTRAAWAAKTTVNAHSFPHVFLMYAGCNDWSNKNCPSLFTSGALRTSAADTLARFQVVGLRPNAFVGPHWGVYSATSDTSQYGALAARIRQRNPSAKLMMYVHDGAIYGPYLPADDTTHITGHQWRRAHEAIGTYAAQRGATLQSKSRPTCYHSAWQGNASSDADSCREGYQWYNLNKAYRDSVTGDYVVVKAHMDVVLDAADMKRTAPRNPNGSDMWDVLALDLYGFVDEGVNALFAATDSVYVNDLGFHDTAAGSVDNRRWQFWKHYDNGAKYGTRYLQHNSDKPMWGNALPWGTIYTADALNGAVVEGWPRDSYSGAAHVNWTASWWGAASVSASVAMPKPYVRPGIAGMHRAVNGGNRPVYSLLIGLGTRTGSAVPSSGVNITDASRKAYRLGLATASLVDGWYWQYYAGGSWGAYGVDEDWGKLTWDEGWVDTDGNANGATHGWLGAPSEDYQSTLVAPGTELLYAVAGDTAYNTATWPAGWARTQTGGTVATSTTNPYEGTYSIECSTSTAAPSEIYNVGFRLRGNAALSVASGAGLTVNFYARSTTPNRFQLVLRDSSTGGPTSGGSWSIWTDGTWRKYTVVLYNTGTSQTDLQLAFYCADTTGRWFFDRITAYAGERVVYSRKFANGMVVLNPSSAAKTFAWADDGKDYKRILGFTNPYTSPTTASRTDAGWANDGSLETDRSISVGATDAVFLISRPTGGWDAAVGVRRDKWWQWWMKRSGAAPTPSK